MNKSIPWCYAALASAAMLVVGCAPDDANEPDIADPAADLEPERGEVPLAGADRDAGGIARTSPPAVGAPGAAVTPGAGAQELIARADLSPVGDGTVRGTVEFLGGAAGPLTINVMMMGLPAGPHGFHVHEGTDCMMPGEHWSPTNAEHGAPDEAADARHRGDLGNITADASGMVQETVRDENLGDDRSYIGKVIVVHTNQDDLTTQPDGDSGEPLACGVIEAAEEAEISQAPGDDRGV